MTRTSPSFLAGVLALAIVLGVGMGAFLLQREATAELDRQAKAVQSLLIAGLDLGKSNPKTVQNLLRALPGPLAFSRLEIRNKSGTWLETRFDEASPSWLVQYLIPEQPVELPLETKGGFVIKLEPSAAFAARRLEGALYLALPVVGAVFLSLLLIAGRQGRRFVSDGHGMSNWNKPLPLPEPAEATPVPVTAGEDACLDRLPVAILHCDQRGEIVYMNTAAAALLLQTGAGGKGQAFSEFLAPWDRNRVRSMLSPERAPAIREPIDTQVLSSRGVLAVTIDVAPLPGGAGMLALLIRDASETRRLQDALNLHARMLDGLAGGVAMIKPRVDGEILYCNRAFRDLLDIPDVFVRPGLFFERVAALAPDASDRIGAVLNRPTATQLTLSREDALGIIRWLALRVTPVDPDHAGDSVLVCELRDCSEETAFRLHAEEDLERQRHIIGEMPLALCMVDGQGSVLDSNPQLVKLTGRSHEQLSSTALDTWLVRDAWKSGPVLQGDHLIRCENGDKIATVTTLTLNCQTGNGYVYLFEDITPFKQRAQRDNAELERLRQILDELAVGIVTTNTDGFIQYFNQHAQRLTGLTEHQFKGMPLGQIIHLVDEKKREKLADPATRAMRIGKTVRFRQDVILVSENKHELAVEVSAAPIRDRKGSVAGCVVVIRDVSEQRSITQQMNLRASRDPLTGLVNRRELLSLLETLQYEVDEQRKQHTLCYMDLDKFKIINDTCGHNAGDELLRQVSDLMSRCLRANDLLARIGGDEFCAVLRNTAADSAVVVAEKVREAIKQFRFAWDGKYFEIGVSIGVFTLTAGFSVEETVSAADDACYMAKEKGRDLVWTASAPTEPAKQISTPWNERLAVAMDHDYFRLFRQDAVFLQPAAGVEIKYRQVLLRLHEPGRAPQNASAFMPSAQRFNLTASIERWVLGKLLSSLATAGIRHGTHSEVFAIQLSAATLGESNFQTFLLEQSTLYGLPPGMICFEISEDDLVQNFTAVQKFMRECAETGYRFCLNQFGAGISSFAYIRSLPLGFLKIDPSLTRQSGVDPVDESIVRAIQDICRHMNIMTIAQQVDGKENLENLRRLGVNYAQGAAVQEPVALEPAFEASRFSA